MLKNFVQNEWFARLDLLLVLGGGPVWLLWSDRVGILPILFLLLPTVLGLVSGADRFHFTPLDGLILLFIITAWIGFSASYDQAAAFHKAIWITASGFCFGHSSGKGSCHHCLDIVCGGAYRVTPIFPIRLP